MVKDDANRAIMKNAEIKKNILNIATDVFRDTQVFFAYLYGSYAVDQAHPFSDLDIRLLITNQYATPGFIGTI
jgi:predicted nucleotidyltransferase